MGTKSFYGIGQGSFYGGGMYGNGQLPVGIIEKTIGPASIVSFNDGLKNKPLKECVVNVEPVQDLHGYDSPWPAGGGKNLANFSGMTLYNDNGTWGLNTIIDSANEEITISGTYTGSITNPSFRILRVPNIENGLNLKTFEITSGNYVRQLRWDGTNQILVVDLLSITQDSTYTIKFKFVAYSDSVEPTAWTPYSNICPITGWTGAQVMRCGKNLCNRMFEHSVYSVSNGVKYSHEGVESRYISFGIVPVKNGTTYVISWTDDENNPCTTGYVIFYRGNTFLGYTSLNNARYFIVPENADGVAVNLLSQNKITSISQIDISNPQLELGSTATDYEPYQGETYDITFPSEAGTVYEGILDVLTGELTATYRGIVLTGDENWALSVSSYDNTFYITSPLPGAISYSKELICSHYPANVKSLQANDNVYIDTGYRLIITANNVEYTLDAWKAYLRAQADAGTPVTVVYKSREGYEQNYQLTPQQITTLLGENNVWADTGDITIKYLAKK